MTIKVLEKTEGSLPQIIDKGDWVDLVTAEEVTLKAPCIYKLRKFRKDDHTERIREVTFDSALIPLGVAMQLPKGFEAVVIPRSSTFKKHGIIQANSEGLIDFSYRGDADEWKFPAIALRNTVIPKGTRIAQFRIQLSQKATVWQKLKWLFGGKVKIEKVDHLNNKARGGFGEGTAYLDNKQN